MGLFSKLFSGQNAAIKKIMPLVEDINQRESRIKTLSDEELRQNTAQFKARFEAGETLDDLLPEAFAVVREAAWRTIGQRHYDVQLIGGVVLHQGRIAEMKTGEGKTLVSTLAAYLNALTGQGVHIVTVNDYLARRDAEWMGKIHTFLGLSVGVILPQLSSEERKAAYACDITYGTNSEFGFDYLRDNMCVYKQHMVQRELTFAIVDEVDSILIDEARTPLIISGRGDDSTEMYKKANKFVVGLTRGEDAVESSRLDSIMGGGDAAFENSGDYSVDEKNKAVTLTAKGVEKAERYFGVERLTDADNTELNHHIQQALKANGLFKKDVNYVIQDEQIMIVDEFTGRILNGRRYSEGLHQAIEAKENVAVKHESKTLATITYQNFFRMYKKMSGMTGTAKTEEGEFEGIYGLDVVEIPTNRPNIRKDEEDLVYFTEEAKYKNVIEEIAQVHKTGRPVLVGTVSVEKSELLSSMLGRRGVPHQVLNAKNHRKEAEIVAQAGKLGTVTIATNMAGRGTDILLGGNSEFSARQALAQTGMEEELIEAATSHAHTQDENILAARREYAAHLEKFKAQTDREHEKVVELGGLHIIGTERHESRRIDNQLRGRAGRQGDPGSTRFYLALEDDIMRLFGGDKVKLLAQKLAGEEAADFPLEMGVLTKQIENAQKRVEGMHFNSRKHVLQYDDVMNKQREIIYAQRRRVLMGEDVSGYIQEMLESYVETAARGFCPVGVYPEEWDFDGLFAKFNGLFPVGDNPYRDVDARGREKITFEGVKARLIEKAGEFYGKKEEELQAAGLSMRDVEREILLRVVDMHWQEHIDAMDQLRDGIGLQSYGRHDPVQEYAIAGFDMFEEMIASINETTLNALLHVTLQGASTKGRRQATGSAGVKRAPSASELAGVKDDDRSPTDRHRTGQAAQPFVAKKTVGRNDPCPCGSGKKYKNCCGKKAEEM